MKSIVVLVALSGFIQISSAQGRPSAVGQTVTPQGASAAERAVQARHDKAVERSRGRAAKRAAKAAPAAGR